MVRRDVRTFVVSGVLLVAALACLALWALDVLAANGRAATLVLGLAAFLVSFVGWASGDTRIRDRLFVLGPALGAAVPIGVGLGGPVGLAVSFALALLATWAFVMSRRRN
jgi:uncharacterized membrane protein